MPRRLAVSMASSTNATTRVRNSIGCGLPICNPHICLKGKESHHSQSGNPESERQRHALVATYKLFFYYGVCQREHGVLLHIQCDYSMRLVSGYEVDSGLNDCTRTIEHGCDLEKHNKN